ncbi:MAG: Fis family transcriptional regulator [Cyanobacteria bacterium P01_D01_bin.73]
MDMQQSFQPDGVGEAASEQVPFEQFELVSAYMDGEVTAQEQLQVERWLKEDPKIQALYADLGGLTESVKQMPVPVSCSAEKTLAAVMDKVQTQQRKRRVWGASAIAAGLAVAIGSVFVGARQPGMQFAQNDPESSPTSSLQIASSPTPSSVTVDNTVQDEPILERALILE